MRGPQPRSTSNAGNAGGAERARMKDAPEWCRPLLRRHRDAPYLNAGLLGGRTPFVELPRARRRHARRAAAALEPQHARRQLRAARRLARPLRDETGGAGHRECGQLANASERARRCGLCTSACCPRTARGVPFEAALDQACAATSRAAASSRLAPPAPASRATRSAPSCARCGGATLLMSQDYKTPATDFRAGRRSACGRCPVEQQALR